jgi:hypothetical protein
MQEFLVRPGQQAVLPHPDLPFIENRGERRANRRRSAPDSQDRLLRQRGTPRFPLSQSRPPGFLPFPH